MDLSNRSSSSRTGLGSGTVLVLVCFIVMMHGVAAQQQWDAQWQNIVNGEGGRCCRGLRWFALTLTGHTHTAAVLFAVHRAGSVCTPGW
jgi:hypothetical protein